MLRIDWLFRRDPGFKQTVQTLANTPDESLFSSELVITLVENFWEEYYYSIVWLVLIPFVIYFLTTMVYFSTYLIDEVNMHHDKDEHTNLEYVLRIILIIMMIYFAAYEILQLFTKGLRYFIEFWNLFDCASFGLNTVLMLNHLFVYNWFERETIVVCSFLAMFCMWWKLIYWFKLFTPTSFYIRLVIQTIWGIRYFFIIFIFILMMFANSIFILDRNRSSNDKLFTAAFEDSQIASAILN